MAAIEALSKTTTFEGTVPGSNTSWPSRLLTTCSSCYLMIRNWLWRWRKNSRTWKKKHNGIFMVRCSIHPFNYVLSSNYGPSSFLYTEDGRWHAGLANWRKKYICAYMASNLVLCGFDGPQTLHLGIFAFPHVKHTTGSLMKCYQ